MSKVAFLTFMPIMEGDGISRKILAQADALRRLGNVVELGYPEEREGKLYYRIGSKLIARYQASFRGKLQIYTSVFRHIARYVESHGIEAIYLRWFLFATPSLTFFLHRMKRRGRRVIVEIPTYPYDGERLAGGMAARLRKISDRIFRRSAARYIDWIVTFSSDKEIWGVPAIGISNGVDLERLPVRRQPTPPEKEFHLIGVAVLAPWHGYDRMLEAIARYNVKYPDERKVVFHVVGTDPGEIFLNRLREQAKELGIEGNVVFHGRMSGKSLDRMFDKAHLAVGSLGRHRNGITSMRSLKNVEYAARGIPFVYSEMNPDFDGKPFIMKVAPDESPLDLREMLRFYDNLRISPKEIRHSALPYSWRHQMEVVSEGLCGKLSDEG